MMYEMVINADEHFHVGSCRSVNSNECVRVHTESMLEGGDGHKSASGVVNGVR